MSFWYPNKETPSKKISKSSIAECTESQTLLYSLIQVCNIFKHQLFGIWTFRVDVRIKISAFFLSRNLVQIYDLKVLLAPREHVIRV